MTLFPPDKAPGSLVFDSRHGAYRVDISTGGVTTHMPASDPPAFTETLLDAFSRGFWRSNAPHAVASEGHLRIASLLDGACLPPEIDRRVRFLRHHDRGRISPVSYAYEVASAPASKTSCDLELTPHGLLGATPRAVDLNRRLHMPDEAFFMGPAEPHMPLAMRVALRRVLFSTLTPGSGLTLADAFPLLDHGRIPSRVWSISKTVDGEEDVIVAGGSFSFGYRWGHDYGYSSWSVERAVSSPEPMAPVPAAMHEEIAAHILAARIDEPPA